jgi:hypothetical protein
MEAPRRWTDQEIQTLIQMRGGDVGWNEIGVSLGRNHDVCRKKYKSLKNADREPRRDPMAEIRAAASNPPIDTDLAQRVRELESEVAMLREQKKWETHSDAGMVTGGKFTLRESDRHCGDENHLLSCAESLEAKACVLIKNYEPATIQHIAFDDWIAGRGIFKEQDLQSAVSDPNHQIHVGAVKALRFYRKIREVTSAPISVHWLRGNHEYANKTSLAESLFLATRMLCEEIPDLTFKMYWDRAIVNLAATGTHNALAMHGFGHSKVSPNSPAFIDAAKDILLVAHRRLQPHEQIRRVMSGHTHYLSVGLERVIGLEFDTTGGLQRNNRVQLGQNARPVGWIAYISPEGQDGEILKPLEIKPESETYERELRDPHLGAANRSDCGDCLREYTEILKQRGLAVDSDEFGTTEGRW